MLPRRCFFRLLVYMFSNMLTYMEVTSAIETNIASFATLRVSSTTHWGGHDYSKENMVDGVISKDVDNCGCCYSSLAENSPFVEANFEGFFSISRVVIDGRHDVKYAAEPLFDFTGMAALFDNTTSVRVTVDANRRRATIYPTQTSTPIRRIRITRSASADGFLTICELQVFSNGCADGYYGTYCNDTCDRSSGSCLKAVKGCALGEFCGVETNIASYATLSVSSTLSYHGHDFEKENAVDGILRSSDRYYADTCGCCYHSGKEASPYIEASFEGNFVIDRIVIVGRTDHPWGPHDYGLFGLNGITALLDNTTYARVTVDASLQGATVYPPKYSTPIHTIRISRPTSSGTLPLCYLVICELEVLSRGCADGFHGSYCNETCGGLCINGQWDHSSGSCLCECTFGFYGKRCDDLIPINASAVDVIRPSENNVHAVNLSVPLVYLGRNYSQLYISKDGFVSLGRAAHYRTQNWSAPYVSPYIDIPFIAPYYFRAESLDIKPDYTGAVTYREFNANQLSQMDASQYIRSQVVGSRDFVADWELEVTWINVTSVNQIETGACDGTYSNPCPTNSFQLMLLTNGIDSYAIFNYGNMNVPPEKYDQAGFNGGHAIGWTNVLRTGESVDQLNRHQGNDTIGRYIYKISSKQITSGECYKDNNHTHLNIFPNYAGMMGGKMIDISGPCFSATHDIRCRFGTLQPGGQPPPVTNAIYVSQTRVRCMVPRLLVRDKIWLSLTLDGSNYTYRTPINIIYVGRMPEAEHVTTLSSSDAATSWLSKNATSLTLTWDGSLLSTDPYALMDIYLFGYTETRGKGEYKQLAKLGGWVRASTGRFTFHTIEHQCSQPDCFNFEIGVVVVSLKDQFSPNVYRYLSSKVLPLGWWVQRAMVSTLGANWPSALCVDWYNRDRQDNVWLQNLLPCPCSLEQSLADFGRWQPDVSCNIVNVNSPDNCFYHKGATHCVRAVQPVGHAGNQCCYNQHGQLVLAQDTFSGSTPDRSHDWGAAPYGWPETVPALSHWLTDVVTFYYCCLWNEYSSCDYYMDSRPTRDCSGYTAPAIASAYGEGHVAPFGGPNYNFRIVAPGDYTLLKAGNTTIQGRFERNLFPTQGGAPVSSVYSLTAVAVENVGTSDRVEMFLRGPDMNNNHQKIDVTVNGEFLTFDDHALSWHDLRGVAVINTDRERRVQSNFTVILTNNIGLQVVEVANTLQLDVVMPPETFGNLTGLLGDPAGNFRTPDGATVDLQALRNSSSLLYQAFLVPWMIRDRNSSLIRGFQYTHGPISFDPKPVPGCSSSVCGGDPECEFDMSITCSGGLAQGTRQAVDRLAMLRQYLQPVRSCGFLDVPRAVKSNYDYTLGTTTTIQKCRVGVLSGPTMYTCAATSNQTQAWSPAVSTTCGNVTLPAIIG